MCTPLARWGKFSASGDEFAAAAYTDAALGVREFMGLIRFVGVLKVCGGGYDGSVEPSATGPLVVRIEGWGAKPVVDVKVVESVGIEGAAEGSVDPLEPGLDE